MSRAIRSLTRLLPQRTALPILKGPLRGKKWVVRSSFDSCWFGIYEYEKQSIFSRFLKPGDVAYDIGANVGFYTLLASVLVGAEGKVYSFEPLPRNINLLRRHVELNHMTNVTVIEGAVSEQAGVARFDADAVPEMAHLTEQGSLEVKTYQVDDEVLSGRIAPPALVKIDVEGAEAAVIRGARQVLERYKPLILLATHGPVPHRESCDLLTAMGYRLEPLDHRPLNESTELLAKAQ